MDQERHSPSHVWYLDAQAGRERELVVEGLVDGFQRKRVPDWFGNLDPFVAFLLAAAPIVALAVWFGWTVIS